MTCLGQLVEPSRIELEFLVCRTKVIPLYYDPICRQFYVSAKRPLDANVVRPIEHWFALLMTRAQVYRDLTLRSC